MSFLDKLLFWRKDEPSDFDVDGCFTLPGAELDGNADATCDPATVDDGAEAGS